jgi:hypothetical protein
MRMIFYIFKVFQAKELLKFYFQKAIIFKKESSTGRMMQVFQISDVIVYGTQGVCRITEIEEKTIGGVKKSYYVLKPVHDNGATIYAPTNNEAVLKKMR